MESGPCLKHCYRAHSVTIYAARLSFVYVFACVAYLLLTRNAGTPFYDSLSEEQRKIKKDSAEFRKNVFVKSLLAGSLVVALLKPFSSMDSVA